MITKYHYQVTVRVLSQTTISFAFMNLLESTGREFSETCPWMTLPLEEDYKYCEVAEKCYQGLLKWRKTLGPENATIKKLCDALQRVGCLKALEALCTITSQSDS